MFAAAVYPRERLFVEQAHHIVLIRNRLHNGHGNLVLIDGKVRRGIYVCEFVLSGGDFVVFGLGEYPEFPQFAVEVVHIIPYASLDFAEVMIFEFLPFGRFRSEKRSAAID